MCDAKPTSKLGNGVVTILVITVSSTLKSRVPIGIHVRVCNSVGSYSLANSHVAHLCQATYGAGAGVRYRLFDVVLPPLYDYTTF